MDGSLDVSTSVAMATAFGGLLTASVGGGVTEGLVSLDSALAVLFLLAGSLDLLDFLLLDWDVDCDDDAGGGGGV